MMVRVLSAAVLGLTLCLAVAPMPSDAAGSKQPAAEQKQDAVPTITVDQFKALQKAKTRYVLIDVRTKAEYDAGHIDGAVLMPLDSLEKTYKRIPKGVKLVVNCRTGHRSAEAVKFLVTHGYKKAVSLDGGFVKWAACAKSNKCS